ncbi:MAG TPA: hypothetical protein VHU83_00795 [Bryobacteraceae bacterium]|jgi:hypothetical protein|nr:hypothetical protein [Bryobacteraceae bacterium]
MRRYLGTLVLGISMLAPVALIAQDHDRHTWSDNENPTWHQYLKEHHKKDHDWGHASKREQKDYWKWRDAHPDTH